jgi:hypothetical protein
VVGERADGVVTRVELVDRGADARVMSVAVATARRVARVGAPGSLARPA